MQPPICSSKTLRALCCRSERCPDHPIDRGANPNAGEIRSCRATFTAGRFRLSATFLQSSRVRIVPGLAIITN